YLRIEDTDDKRYVEGAVKTIIDSLDFFDIHFDEGATLEGDKGSYGPYSQSERGEIYKCFVKDLVKEGFAYPCFMTEEEIAQVRKEQEANKLTPGIYGKYAKCRDLSIEEVEANIAAGKPYVIRLRSTGNHDLPPEKIRQIQVKDAIRGKLSMPENMQDIVILKTTGIPTYHFAHVIDDHFMRTTHVVRGEEWLSSLPIHIELFEKLGFEPPVYCHTAQLMKLDENGNKRKLSKRKDPELSLDYYKETGYHPSAVCEYLLTILNSNYEEWRKDNPDSPADDFPFSLDKMSNSGALFDLDKLSDVSKDTLVKIPAPKLYEFLLGWAEEFRPDLVSLISGNKEMVTAALDIGRSGNKPRKDLVCASQMFDFISFFFDDFFEVQDELPEQVSPEDCKEILARYLDTYDHADDQSAWFDKIRAIATDLGYAAKPKDYKKNPDDFKGHVGHVSTAIRLALTGKSQSPDIWEIQQILGEEKTRQRVTDYAAKM
ncbi:MAG: glutamate--tRNA ligase, partial [Firmicutes bacterium]|nr:glutamate--tRNA ligase [Bacillota bacterium]